MPNRQDARNAVYRENVDPDEQAGWPEQHKWLADRLNDLYEVFATHIKKLNAEDWQPEDEDAEEVAD